MTSHKSGPEVYGPSARYKLGDEAILKMLLAEIDGQQSLVV